MNGQAELCHSDDWQHARDQTRNGLFQAIDRIADTLQSTVAQGDELRRLPASALAALQDSGLIKLKLQKSLGGYEADNALQFEVFERVAYHNAAASWCLFIYTDVLGLAASRLSDEGLATVFGKQTPLLCGGGGMVFGQLKPVDGGYLITGRWPYGSGVDAADWVAVMAMPPDNGPQSAKPLFCLIPRDSVKIVDNWHVLGMKGTGSSDFLSENAFVPHSLTYSLADVPRRGGGLYVLGMMGYVSHTIPAMITGIARSVINNLSETAKSKRSGYTKRATLAQRNSFHTFLGESDIKIKAARALMLENGVRIVADAERRGCSAPENEAECRAAGHYVTRCGIDIISRALFYAGSSAGRSGNALERALRDAHFAGTHYFVSDTSLENHGQLMLGIEGVDPAS